MTQNVSKIQLTEDAQICVKSLTLLRESLGTECSQEVIERAVFEISERLEKIELALVGGEVQVVGKLSKSLIGVAEQIGLMRFSRVAKDVVICVQSQDRIALAAVTQRLLRLGDSSLFATMHYPEMPY